MLSYVLGRGRFTIIQLARGRNWALRVGAAKGPLLVDPASGGKLGAMHVGPAVHMLQPGSLPFCVHPFGAPRMPSCHANQQQELWPAGLHESPPPLRR